MLSAITLEREGNVSWLRCMVTCGPWRWSTKALTHAVLYRHIPCDQLWPWAYRQNIAVKRQYQQQQILFIQHISCDHHKCRHVAVTSGGRSERERGAISR